MTTASVEKHSTAEYLVVFCTSPSQSQAEALATLMVEQSLAACIHLVPKITAIYRWQGKIMQEEEVLMVIKTRQWCYDPLEALIRQNHPYEVPEIVAVPILSGSSSYLHWISQETSFNINQLKEERSPPRP